MKTLSLNLQDIKEKDKSTEIEISDYGCRTERRNSRIVWQLFCSILLEKFSDGKHHKGLKEKR